MAKLATMFFILIAIQFCLILYVNGPAETTSLWSFVTNIDQWNWSNFVVTFGSIAAAALLVGISAGGTFRYVTDFLVFASAIVGFVSIGIVFIQLAGAVRDTLISTFFTACSGVAAQSCTPATLVTGVIVGPFMFYYIWTVIEWWRGKDN